MSLRPLDLSGGESVYCISKAQLAQAWKLGYGDPRSAARIQQALRQIETHFDRNERAALAFLLIQRLLASADEPPAANPKRQAP